MKKRLSLTLILFFHIIFSIIQTTNIKAFDNDQVYNYELMKKNNIQPGLGSDYESVDRLIQDVMKEYGVEADNISLAFYNFYSDQHYYINPDKFMIAASTVKVPIVGLYLDLISQASLNYESMIPFSNSYLIEGNGQITNSELQSAYLLSDLMFNSIVYSDNTAWHTLMGYYSNFGSYRDAILDFINYYNVPQEYFVDNYNSAFIAEQWLIKIAQDSKYDYLINLMKETDPAQLFRTYVNKGMANKYGQLDNYLHDTGIYYEDEQAQYVLAVYTENLASGYNFLEVLNLRINEWYRSKYLDKKIAPLDIQENEAGIKIQIKSTESTESIDKKEDALEEKKESQKN